MLQIYSALICRFHTVCLVALSFTRSYEVQTLELRFDYNISRLDALLRPWTTQSKQSTVARQVGCLDDYSAG
ncbi:hypothetical protein LX36DRAFT_659440 [Colletotrichum falcatum]|nr:hypothetical protein LX36DRAFT_659440 [Colletotrichum falcatum]